MAPAMITSSCPMTWIRNIFVFTALVSLSESQPAVVTPEPWDCANCPQSVRPICVNGITFRHRCIADCQGYLEGRAGACEGDEQLGQVPWVTSTTGIAARSQDADGTDQDAADVTEGAGAAGLKTRMGSTGASTDASRSSQSSSASRRTQKMSRFQSEGLAFVGSLDLRNGPAAAGNANHGQLRSRMGANPQAQATSDAQVDGQRQVRSMRYSPEDGSFYLEAAPRQAHRQQSTAATTTTGRRRSLLREGSASSSSSSSIDGGGGSIQTAAADDDDDAVGWAPRGVTDGSDGHSASAAAAAAAALSAAVGPNRRPMGHRHRRDLRGADAGTWRAEQAGSVYPFSALAYIRYKSSPGSPYYERCTGTFITPWDVLTAAHCVWNFYDATGISGWSIYPGVDARLTSTSAYLMPDYVTFYRTEDGLGKDYSNSTQRGAVNYFDIALIRVKSPHTAWLGIKYDCDRASYAKTLTCGYPTNSNSFAPLCQQCFLSTSQCRPLWMMYDYCWSYFGSSGMGIMDSSDTRLLGVLSGGEGADFDYSYWTPIDAFHFSNLVRWMWQPPRPPPSPPPPSPPPPRGSPPPSTARSPPPKASPSPSPPRVGLTLGIIREMSLQPPLQRWPPPQSPSPSPPGLKTKLANILDDAPPLAPDLTAASSIAPPPPLANLPGAAAEQQPDSSRRLEQASSTVAAAAAAGYRTTRAGQAEGGSAASGARGDYAYEPQVVGGGGTATSVTNGALRYSSGARQQQLVTPQPCKDGAIRLSDGPNSWSGRVEICNNAVWGTICDAGWGWDDARVACRQLGYPSGGEALQGGWFPGAPDTTPVHHGNVSCLGHEATLFSCKLPSPPSECRVSSSPQSPWDHRADAGLICLNGAVASPPPSSDSTNGSNSWQPGDYPCREEGAVRLAPSTISSGQGSWVGGRLEICASGQWGSVCDDDWNNADAAVACKQLGYPTGRALSQSVAALSPPAAGSAAAQALTRLSPGPLNMSIWLSNVDCLGSEASLVSCTRRSALGRTACTHQEDAGVLCFGTPATAPKAPSQPPPPECSEDGALRLVPLAGQPAGAGRLQVCYGGRYGLVCDRNFGLPEARVACRQLGYMYGRPMGPPNAATAGDPGPGAFIWMDDVRCTIYRVELGFWRLTQCRFSGWGSSTCNPRTQAVGLVCSNDSALLAPAPPSQPPPSSPPSVRSSRTSTAFCDNENAVRIVNAAGAVQTSTPAVGRVEICQSGKWGAICIQNNAQKLNWWSDDSATVACLSAVGAVYGYPSPALPLDARDPRVPALPPGMRFWRYGAGCSGYEGTLGSCESGNGAALVTCTALDVAGVWCP